MEEAGLRSSLPEKAPAAVGKRRKRRQSKDQEMSAERRLETSPAKDPGPDREERIREREC